MPIYVEEGCAAMLLAANAIGQLAKRGQVVSCEQSQTIRKRKSLATLNLFGHGSQYAVV
jgi:hypothetical protein